MANRHPRNRLRWNKGLSIWWTWLVDVDRRQSTVLLILRTTVFFVKVLSGRERERDEKERLRADKRGH